LTKAVELLVSGCSIKEVAFRIGYRQSSAFVELFRQTFGTTPKAWITALEVRGPRSTELQAKGGNVPGRSARGMKQGARQRVLRCSI
jgi:AraC-like DNA-binding protein